MFITGLVSLREEGWRGDLDPPVAPRAQASCVSYGEDVFGAGAACKAHSRAKSYSCCSLVLFSTAVPVYSRSSFSFIEIGARGGGGCDVPLWLSHHYHHSYCHISCHHNYHTFFHSWSLALIAMIGTGDLLPLPLLSQTLISKQCMQLITFNYDNTNIN